MCVKLFLNTISVYREFLIHRRTKKILFKKKYIPTYVCARPLFLPQSLASSITCVCLHQRCEEHLLPSLLPLSVASDEMLRGWEPNESRLSRESSLLCPPPPSSVGRWSSSRSGYQLSPKPLSLTLPPFGLDVSCRACAHKHADNGGVDYNI